MNADEIRHEDGYEVKGDPGETITIYPKQGNHTIDLMPLSKDGRIRMLKIFAQKKRPVRVTLSASMPLIIADLLVAGNIWVDGLDDVTVTSKAISGKSTENSGRGVS